MYLVVLFHIVFYLQVWGRGASTLIGKGNPLKVASITGLLCAAYYGWQIKTEDGEGDNYFAGHERFGDH